MYIDKDKEIGDGINPPTHPPIYPTCADGQVAALGLERGTEISDGEEEEVDGMGGESG